METLCPCGCGRLIPSVATDFAPTYVDAAATRELADHFATICPKNTIAADDLRIAQTSIATLVEALKRSLHQRPQLTDRTYIDRMRPALDSLRHGLAAQIAAMDPEFFRNWMDRTRARQPAA